MFVTADDHRRAIRSLKRIGLGSIDSLGKLVALAQLADIREQLDKRRT